MSDNVNLNLPKETIKINHYPDATCLNEIQVLLNSIKRIRIDMVADMFCLSVCRDEYDSEGSEASDDDARPLTRNELQNKVMKTVRKRESAAKKDSYKYDLPNARDMQKNKKDKKWITWISKEADDQWEKVLKEQSSDC